MKLRLLVSILAGVCAAVSHLSAQTFIWIGFDPGGNEETVFPVTTGANWQGGTAPSLATHNLQFGAIGGTQTLVKVGIPGPAAFNNITFTDLNRPEYEFVGETTLQLNGNVTIGPSTNGFRVFFRDGLTLTLSAGVHTVDIAPDLISGELLVVNALVDGAGSLVKTGTGTLALRNVASHTGGTIIKNGVVELKEQGAISHATADLVIGQSTGDDALLYMPFGGSIAAKDATLGLGAGSEGAADIAGSSTWTSTSLVIGAAGTGTFNYEGGTITTTSAVLGQAATGTGSAFLTSGSHWTNFETLTIGDSGTGSLFITSEALVQAGDTYLGFSAGSTGIVLISNGATFRSSSTGMVVGRAGSGLLAVSDNAQLDVGDGSGIVTLGLLSGGSGFLTIGASSPGPGASPGVLNIAEVTTGAGIGILNFHTDTNSGSPYHFTKDGTVDLGYSPIGITGATQVINSGGYNVLMAPTSYTGGTLITAGTLAIGVDNALPTAGGVTLFADSDTTATLNLNGLNQTIGNLTLGGADGSAFSKVDIGTGGALTFTGTISFVATNNPDGALITGGTLLLGGDNIINVGDSTNAGHDLTIASDIGGAGSGLIKKGAGTLILSGTNTYTFGTIIENGILAPLADASLPATRDITISPSTGATATLQILDTTHSIGTLTLGGAGASTTSQPRVAMSAEGFLTLGGNINYVATGNPLGGLIQGGTISLGANRTISVENSSTAPIDLTISSLIIGPGFGITKSNAGTLLLSGANTYTGATSITGGLLMISADNNLGTAPGSPTPAHLTLSGGSAVQFTSSFTLAANRGISFGTGGGTLIVDSGVALTYGGIMAGSGAFTKTGNGILILSGQSTQSGSVFLNGGTIRLGINNALSSGTALTMSPTAAGNGVLDLNGFSQSLSSLTLGGGTTSSGSVVNLGTGGSLALTSITFNAANNPLGATIDGGTLTFSSALGINVGDSTTAAFDLAIMSNITGTGGLVKSGAGALALLGTGSYSGGTTINAGRLALGAVNALPIGGDVLIAALPTGTTRLDLGTFSQSIGSLEFRGGTSTSTGTLTIDSGAALSLGGNLTYTATNNPAGATIVGVGGTPGTLNLGSTSHIFDIGNSTNAAFDLTISAPITGSGGGFTKNGAGMLYLPGVNTYTGATILNAGTVYIDADSALGTAPGTPTPGHLQFDGGTLYNFNSFTLNANRGVSLGGSGGTFQVDTGGTLTYGGIIAGAGGLTKTGPGSLSLSGANTYSGFTTATAGTLSLTASNALPVNNTVVLAPVSPSGSALLQLNGTSQAVTALTLGGGAANSTSTVNIGTGGVLTMSSTLTYNQNNNPAGASITGGTLLLGANLQFSVGDSTATASDLTISSSISGAGFGFTKTGTGTLVLSGPNIFTGGMTVSDGTVRLAANTLGGQNVVINKVGAGGTAAVTVDAGTSQSIGSLTFGGPTAGSATTNTLTLGTGATVTLGGNVTYDASNNPLGTTISNGTMALGATRTFAINDSTGTVNELTVASELSGAGFGLTKTGTGVLALTGVNTFTGTTSVFSGTLQIAADSGLGAAPGTPTAGQLVIDGGTLQNTATMALSTNRGINLGSGAGTFNTAAGTTLAYGGIIAGPGALIKSGTGTLTLAGANSYTGGTALNNGKLVVSHPAALGSGVLNFNGGDLVVSPGITLSNTLNFTGSGGRIGGNGTFASAVSAGPNVTLAPGTSPGLTTFTGALTWATGGSYDFEVVTANGSAGTGYDSINVTGAGSFAITATSGGKFNLNLLSLSNATTPGNVSDFLSTGTYSWQIASSVNPITGFAANAFNINTSGFTNSLGAGSFSVSINGANTAIFLNFSPIPEPSTYALMALGAGALVFTTRRRRRS